MGKTLSLLLIGFVVGAIAMALFVAQQVTDGRLQVVHTTEETDHG